MNFELALERLKTGKRVCRTGWNGSKRPVFFAPPSREPHLAFGLVWIRLSDGEVAVCDAGDYDLVAPHTWSCMDGYPVYTENKSVPRQTVRLHQVLCPDWDMVDHINGDPLDNRRENLRQCTAVQNVANSKSYRGTSCYKGVSWDSSREKWISSIQQARKTKHLGRFDHEGDAARAYDAAAIEAHGEFARLNFPQPKMWLILVKPMFTEMAGLTYDLHCTPASPSNLNEVTCKPLPWICMKTADNCFVPWLASHTDLFAKDWEQL